MLTCDSKMNLQQNLSPIVENPLLISEWVMKCVIDLLWIHKELKNGSGLRGAKTLHRPAPSPDLSNGFPSCQRFVCNLKKITREWNPASYKEPFRAEAHLTPISTSSNSNRSSCYLTRFSILIHFWLNIQARWLNVIRRNPSSSLSWSSWLDLPW